MAEYINRLRIEKAKRLLLRNGEGKLYQLSDQLGFNSESHFVRLFKKYAGMTTTAFKRSIVE